MSRRDIYVERVSQSSSVGVEVRGLMEYKEKKRLQTSGMQDYIGFRVKLRARIWKSEIQLQGLARGSKHRRHPRLPPGPLHSARATGTV